MSESSLNYKVFGEGDPIIILHGLFGMLDNWQSFAKSLAEHYMVYIIDQRDHGKSPHTDNFDYPSLSEDLKQFMESQWIYGATIIGHSMGGKVAMQFAAEYEDMVNRLIVVDIGPKAYERKHDTIFKALLDLNLSEVHGRNDIINKLSESIHDPSVIHFLMKNVKRLKDGGYEYKFNLPLLYRAYDNINSGIEIMEPISCPTLFVRGKNSNYISDEDFTEIKNLFTNSRLITVDDAGHWVHADQPKVLLDHITSFLNNSE